MVPMWKFGTAIATGNTFILKPSEKGHPPNFLASCSTMRGSRTASSTSSTATRSPSMRSSSIRTSPRVSFVGSTPIARHIYETGTRNGKRVQALGGAQEPHHRPAGRGHRHGRRRGRFRGVRLGGERCMAISVVVAVGDIADPLVEALKVRCRRSRSAARTPMPRWAPSSTREHRDKVASSWIRAAQGADLVVDGDSTCCTRKGRASSSACRCSTG